MLKQPLLPSRDRGGDGDSRSINGSSTGRPVSVVSSSTTSSSASNGRTSGEGAAAPPPPAVSQKSLLLSNKAQQPVSPAQSQQSRTAILTVSLMTPPRSAPPSLLQLHFVSPDPSRLSAPLPQMDRPPSRRTTRASTRQLPAAVASAASATSASSSSPSLPHSASSAPSWRQLTRTRTVAACLILCLNIGVDPPDSAKPPHPSVLECWLDPLSLHPPLKALKQVGVRLQSQYERWHPHCKYRLLLDPTSDDMRKLVTAARKAASAPGERLLFHYCGHGVPRPTNNGEVWVYNRGYTQYIPVSMYDVQAWMGGITGASVFVIDCSAAGLVMDAFMHFLKQRKDKQQQLEQKQQGAAAAAAAITGQAANTSAAPASSSASSASEPYDCRHIFLCACSATESLPSMPQLPADLFTSCLTTPIKMALRWAASRSSLTSLPLSSIDLLPGMKKPNNRRTPFGELNWIFTAITDAIAWSSLPQSLFQQLFRQDLLVASLFRNYFLAQRIFASLSLRTQTQPPLPPTHNHPMWASWDLAVDVCLSQLERYESRPDAVPSPFTPSSFFSHQLTAFELYLDYAAPTDPPPLQLPVLLQVLLSSDHRRRALLLLSRYLDKGGWAVEAALNVGVFPYVLKLLQSVDGELRDVLVFIWAKVVGWDDSVVVDLARGEYIHYFVRHLLSYRGGGGGGGGAGAAGSAGADTAEMRSSSSSASFGDGGGASGVDGLHEEDELKEDGEEERRDDCGRRDTNGAPHHSSGSSSLIFAPSPHFLSPSESKAASPPSTPPPIKSNLASSSSFSCSLPPGAASPSSPSSFPATSAASLSSPSSPHAVTNAVSSLLSTPSLQHLLSAFILTTIAHHNPRASLSLLSPLVPSLSALLRSHLHSPFPLLRRWLLLLLSSLLYHNPPAIAAASPHLPDDVYPLLFDAQPEVRAAAVLCLSSLVMPVTGGGGGGSSGQWASSGSRVEVELALGFIMSGMVHDGSALVRREMVIALGEVVYAHSELFVRVSSSSSSSTASSLSSLRIAPAASSKKAFALWRSILRCCRDPHPSVSSLALELRKWVKTRVLFSNPLGRMIQSQHKEGLREMPAFSPLQEDGEMERREGERQIGDDDRQQTAMAEKERSRDGRSKAPQQLVGAEMQQLLDGAVVKGERDDSDDSDVPVPPARPPVPLGGPLRHFDRYKMSHMRQHAHAAASPALALSAASTAGVSVLAASASSAAATSPAHSSPSASSRRITASPSPTSGDEFSSSPSALPAASSSSASSSQVVDDRVNDPTWTLPRSSLYSDSALYFSSQLLSPSSSSTPIPPLASITSSSSLSALRSSLSARAASLSSSYTLGDPANAKSFVEVAFFDTDWLGVGCVSLHPYEKMLYACDDRQAVGVWAYGLQDERGQERLNVFNNDNVRGSRITQLALVNAKAAAGGGAAGHEHEGGGAMLFCASDDGVLRLWKNVEREGKQQLVTAWMACPPPEQAALAVAAAGKAFGFPRGSPPFSGKQGAAAAGSMSPGSLSLTPASSSPSTSSGSLSIAGLSTPPASSSPPSASHYSLATAAASFSLRKRHHRAPPCVFDWSQNTGHLCVTAHSLPIAKLWDVTAERCVLDFSLPVSSSSSPSGSAAPSVTAVLSSPVTADIYYLGRSDGSVYLYDVRAHLPCLLRHHAASVVAVQCQHYNATLVSASTNGDVCIGDLRGIGATRVLHRPSHHTPLSAAAASASASGSASPSSSSSSSSAAAASASTSSSSLTCFSAHPALPLLASGSARPFVELFDVGNYTLEQIKYHYGFLGQRIGAVQAVQYHDYRQLCAVSCNDPYLSLFAAEKL